MFMVISCRQEMDLPVSYDVTFRNNYFEVLNSLEFNNQKIENFCIGEEQTIKNVSGGSYDIKIFTQSGLEISAVISLVGTNSSVWIIVTEAGRLVLL
jgi:hypothetical protein